MLSHNSNIALQFILSNPIPHKDTHIKASKVSNFNEAHKWLLIEFFLGNPFSHIPILDDKYFFPQVSWDVVNWYTTHWCLDKIAMPRTNHLFSPSCLEVSTNSSKWALLALLSTSVNTSVYDQSLQPLR